MSLQIGQKILVNRTQVLVERYLNQGGFSQLYLVSNLDQPQNQMVLKVILGNDEGMTSMVEMETRILKLFQSRQPCSIVGFIDHVIRPRSSGKSGFECLILMEYCPGGSVIEQLKNLSETKQRSMSEREILGILYDTCNAVALLHGCTQPGPVIHRDIKAENVLIARDGRYKLCDFGSCSLDPWISWSTREIPTKQLEIEKNTTLTYRAPELCDLYLGWPITTKVDIWALGIMTHLLIFQKQPFESPLAILNGAITINQDSCPYSKELLHLMKWMLVKNPTNRPNIYQIMDALSSIAGTKNPLDQALYPDPCTNPSNFVDLLSRGSLESPVIAPSSAPKNLNTSSIMIDPNLNPIPSFSFPIANTATSFGDGRHIGESQHRRGRPVRNNATVPVATSPQMHKVIIGNNPFGDNHEEMTIPNNDPIKGFMVGGGNGDPFNPFS